MKGVLDTTVCNKVLHLRSATYHTKTQKTKKKQCLRLIHITGGTQCYNESWTATNGTFYCPQPGEPLDWTSCCGATSRQYCCAPKVPEKRNNATIDIM